LISTGSYGAIIGKYLADASGAVIGSYYKPSTTVMCCISTGMTIAALTTEAVWTSNDTFATISWSVATATLSTIIVSLPTRYMAKKAGEFMGGLWNTASSFWTKANPDKVSSFGNPTPRHCEERSDTAIQNYSL
jgi:hypothetical protein